MEERPRTDTPTEVQDAEPAGPPSARKRRGRARRGRATRRRHPSSPCLNCGDPREGDYCPRCGQRKIQVLVSVRAMVADFLEDEFILNRRLPRTLVGLFFQPGFLTVEHNHGRIASYVRPLKLYLVSSVLFFLLLSFFSLRLLAGANLERDRPAARGDAAEETMPDGTPAGSAFDVAEPGTPPAGSTPDVPDSGDAPGPTPRDRPATVGELVNLEGQVLISTGVEPLDSLLVRRVVEIGDMTPRQALERFVGAFLQYVPMLMFILLPVFALVLKLLHIRRHRFYAEHFVFLLHVQAFVYLIFGTMLVIRGLFSPPGWLLVLLFGWTGIYVLLAMKRVYAQGWLKTLVKYCALGFTYVAILSVSVPVVLFVSFLLF